MKRIVILILGALLLAPGIVTAADGKPTPEQPGGAATRNLPLKLDLNRVTPEELVGVPGIGPRMAEAIVDLRSKKGSFTRLEELLEVTGIKEKKFASIAGYLEVVPPRTSAATAPASPSK